MVVAVKEFEGEEILSTAETIIESDVQHLTQSTAAEGVIRTARLGTQRARVWDLNWSSATAPIVDLLLAHYRANSFEKFRFNRLNPGGSGGPVVTYAGSPSVQYTGKKHARVTVRLQEVGG